jgi:tetratricopeptide (TPR) repeat protein
MKRTISNIIFYREDIMKKTIISVFILFISVSSYAYSTNWYAESHFVLGKSFYQNEQYNKAIKEFQVAIAAYETSVITSYSPERGKIYYYMALSYYQLLENFAINDPNYKILGVKAKAVLKEAIEIQFSNPVVQEYYSSSPNLIFKTDELSFIPEIKQYQELVSIQKMFAKREKSNMFIYSRNLNLKHNILEMNVTTYTEVPPTPEELVDQQAKQGDAQTQTSQQQGQKQTSQKKEQSQTPSAASEKTPPSTTPSQTGGSSDKTPPPIPEESQKKAQEVDKETQEIMPTNY